MDDLLRSFGQINGLKYKTSGTEHWIYGPYRGCSFLCQVDVAMNQLKITCTYDVSQSTPVATETELYQPDRPITANSITDLFIAYLQNPLAESIFHKPRVEKLYFWDDTESYSQKSLNDAFDAMSDFANTYVDCHTMITTLGGRTIPALQEISTWKGHKLEPIAWQLLQDIAQQTTKELAAKCYHLLCPYCLVFCTPNQMVVAPDRLVKFYGCRTCHQSNEFLDVEGFEIVAMLDCDTAEDIIERKDILYGNWSKRRQLFDFSRVEIIQANNEDIERFAVQIGNDTDPLRQPHYNQMSCTVSSDCHLPQDTIRILERTFGEVSYQSISHPKIG